MPVWSGSLTACRTEQSYTLHSVQCLVLSLHHINYQTKSGTHPGRSQHTKDRDCGNDICKSIGDTNNDR